MHKLVIVSLMALIVWLMSLFESQSGQPDDRNLSWVCRRNFLERGARGSPLRVGWRCFEVPQHRRCWTLPLPFRRSSSRCASPSWRYAGCTLWRTALRRGCPRSHGMQLQSDVSHWPRPTVLPLAQCVWERPGERGSRNKLATSKSKQQNKELDIIYSMKSWYNYISVNMHLCTIWAYIYRNICMQM